MWPKLNNINIDVHDSVIINVGKQTHNKHGRLRGLRSPITVEITGMVTSPSQRKYVGITQDGVAYTFGDHCIVTPPVKKTVAKPKLNKNGLTKDEQEKIDLAIENFWNCVDHDRSHNSCGIEEYDNVNDDYCDMIRSIKSDLKPILLKLFKESFLKNLKDIGAFQTISLTRSSNKELMSILDEFAKFQTDWRRNPNSGNMIKIWIF